MKQFFFRLERITYSARELNEMGAKPGGMPKTFCDPVNKTSMFQRSINIGVPPTDATPSTASKQSYLKPELNYCLFKFF